jgi:hypothetical protein
MLIIVIEFTVSQTLNIINCQSLIHIQMNTLESL